MQQAVGPAEQRSCREKEGPFPSGGVVQASSGLGPGEHQDWMCRRLGALPRRALCSARHVERAGFVIFDLSGFKQKLRAIVYTEF